MIDEKAAHDALTRYIIAQNEAQRISWEWLKLVYNDDGTRKNVEPSQYKNYVDMSVKYAEALAERNAARYSLNLLLA